MPLFIGKYCSDLPTTKKYSIERQLKGQNIQLEKERGVIHNLQAPMININTA